MKQRLELGPKGVLALARLASHVLHHGTFAQDGKRIAAAMLHFADAAEDEKAWKKEDHAAGYAGGNQRALQRLADSCADLFEKKP